MPWSGTSRQKTLLQSETIQKTPVLSVGARSAPATRKAIFSLGPSTAHSLFVKSKKRMGGGMLRPSPHSPAPQSGTPQTLIEVKKGTPLWK